MTIPLPTCMAYADKVSVRAGDSLTFFVHVDGAGEYNAEIVRLHCGDTGPKGDSEAALASFAGTPAPKMPMTSAAAIVIAPTPKPARAAGRAATRASTRSSMPSRLAGTGACASLINTASRSMSFTPPL